MLLLLFLGTVGALAQTTITGTVEDSNGEPLIGASVLVKGSMTGVSTDIDGQFKIAIPNENTTLVFSYVGCKTTEAKAVDGMKVVMVEDHNALEEVVVVGYGSQKKSVVTAAISKVGSEQLEQTAAVRVDNALKGLTSGVTVTAANGQPGTGAQVRVRGIGTINNSNPLYIVDGMPIDGGIDYLNPSDIKSIEVLKDAASGAVYGARAANGVILVTTKAGQTGRAKIT